MRAEISALLDGELDEHEVRDTVASLRRSDELRTAWCDYQTIGAALRKEDGLSRDITARVMAGLAQEVTCLAPQTRGTRAPAWQRSLMAVAASAAGVAIVGWVAFPAQLASQHLARSASIGAASSASAQVVAVRPASRQDMQDYLIAHQAHAPAMQMAGGTQNIRTVSVSSGGTERR